MNPQKGVADMTNKKIKNNTEAKPLSDEEIKTVNGGMKIVVEEEETSWFQTILDFFFKIKK